MSIRDTSLFPETDIPNRDFLEWKQENSDIYKAVELPINKLAGKWIYSSNKNLKIMTDEKFQFQGIKF